MNNPGTSLNFDAQAMYLEEENQLEAEENQRQNELKALLSNAFDDMIDEDDEEEEEDDDDDDEEENEDASSTSDLGVGANYHQNTIKAAPPQPNLNYMHQLKVQQQQQHYSTPAPGNTLLPQLALQATMIPTADDTTMLYQNDADNNQLSINNDSFKLHLENDAPLTPNNPIVVEYAPAPNAAPSQPQLIDDLEFDGDENQFATQQQFMNIDEMHKEYGRLKILYGVRGKKIEEVTGKFEAFKEDVSRELRAMSHRVHLAEQERDSAQMSLVQSNELVAQCKQDIDTLHVHNKELGDEIERLKSVNSELNAKMAHMSEEIENLNYQLLEQQKCDSIDRLKQQHEQVVQSLRDGYEHELFALKESLNKMQMEMHEKHNLCELFKTELDKAAKTAEQAFIERADTVQRLNKKLQEVQKQYDELLLAPRASESAGEKDALIAALGEKNRELEEQLKLHEAMQLCSASVSDVSELNASQGESMKRELERALNALKVKRAEAQKYQGEIAKLKGELKESRLVSGGGGGGGNGGSVGQFVSNAQKDLMEKDRLIETLNEQLGEARTLIDELGKEKYELGEDVRELRSKLEQYHALEDEFAQARSHFEHEVFVKNEQIEGLLLKQHEVQLGDEQRLALIAKYEGEISALKVQIETSNVEITKVKQLYLDVCNERNDIEVNLKMSFEKEMMIKLEQARNEMDLEINKREMLILAKQEAFVQLSSKLDEVKLDRDALEKRNLEMVEKIKLAEQCKFEGDNERFVELNKRVEDFARLNDELNKKLENFARENGELSKKLENFAKENEELNRKLENFDRENGELNKKLENFGRENEDLVKKLDNFGRENGDLIKKLEIFGKENDELNKRIGDFGRDNLEFKQMNDRLNVELLSEGERMKSLQDQLASVGAECERLRALNKKLEDSLSDVERLSRVNEENLAGKLRKIEAEYEETRVKMGQVSQLNEFLVKENEALKRDAEAAKRNSGANGEECERLRAELSFVKTQSEENCRKMSKELESKLSEELAKISKAKMGVEAVFKAKEEEYVAEIARLNALVDELRVEVDASAKKLNEVVSRKEDEFQTQIAALEKRFENDYSKFLQTNKENLARTLQEKNDEFSREKEAYEAKIREFEMRELAFGKQIKEMRKHMDNIDKERANSVHSIASQADLSERLQLPAQYSPQINANLSELHALRSEKEQLLAQIKQQEELINNADEHFEHEIEKLRAEYEDEYRVKLESELRIALMEENDKRMGGNNKQHERLTSKYQHELSIRDKKLETIEQAYQTRVEQYQAELNELKNNMGEMSEKHEMDLMRIRREIDEQYKAVVARMKFDNDSLQNLVGKMKKSAGDADRVIENLKEEMKKSQAAHLDELSTMKLGYERDKEALSIKLAKAEKLSTDNDERFKSEIEALKAKLKQEYGAELSKMNAKMKDMMKSHASAVELLKKQHTADKVKLTVAETAAKSVVTYSTNSQTECTLRDLALLEAFKDKYMDTLSKMKSDMIRQFDEQTLRFTDKLKRELEDERKRLIENMRAVISKRVSKILREYHVSETLIKTAINEIEFELMNLAVPDSRLVSGGGANFESASINKELSANVVTRRPLSAHSTSAIESPSGVNYAQVKRIEHLEEAQLNSNSNYVRRFKPNVNGGGGSDAEMRDLQPFVNSPTLSSRVNSSRGGGALTPSRLGEEKPTSTTPSYKYTPLRQSWSNLSQVNTQLSPVNIGDEMSGSNVNNMAQVPSRTESPAFERAKERPNSASNLLYRVNNSASSLAESCSNGAGKTSEHDILNTLHSMDVSAFRSGNLRNPSTSTTVGAAQASMHSPEVAQKFSSLPRNAGGVASLKGPASSATLPSRPASTTNAMFGLSVYKDSVGRKGESDKSGGGKVYSNITTTRTKASYHHQFEDTYPVKELDVSVSTISSTVTNYQQQQQQQRVASGTQSEYQVPIRSPTAQIMSASYRNANGDGISESSKSQSKSQSQATVKTSSYKPAVSESTGSRASSTISKLTEKLNFQKKKQIFS